MHGWRNQEARRWPAVPVPEAAPPVAWYSGQVQSHGHGAEESSARRDPHQAARAAGGRSEEVKERWALGSLSAALDLP